jgi:hypothetical protein
MAHAGSAKPAPTPRRRAIWLAAAIQRRLVLIAVLAILAMLASGCSITGKAGAQEREDRDRGNVQQQQDDDDDEGEDEDEEEGEEEEEDVDGSTTTSTTLAEEDDDEGEEEDGDDPTDTTEDPTDTTEDPTDTTEDPGQGGGNGDLPFATDACDPDGLEEADGNQTDGRGALCNTGIFGVIPGGDQTPSVKLETPVSAAGNQTFGADEEIPCKIEFINFEPGLFDGTGKNGQASQFGLRPFSLGKGGDPRGHAHCYIRNDEGGPTSALLSFLALNEDSPDGKTLEGNMPPTGTEGTLKMCVDLAGGNHMTFPKGVAQNFPATDCTTIEVGGGGGGGDGGEEEEENN